MLLLLSALFVGPAHGGQVSGLIQSAPAFIWAGIDLTRARFFVPETFDKPDEIVAFDPGGGLRDEVHRYKDPAEAWTDLSEDWNTMLLNILEEDFEKVLQRDLVVDMPGPAGQTQKKPPYFLSQYEAKNNPPDLDATQVAAMVKKYRLKTKAGVALVFIYERGSRLDDEGCVWPTFFDAQKKTVIWSERMCQKPGGVGFRNYWLKPVVKVGEDLVKRFKKEEL
ncbi:MAG: hypothetical protein ACOZNI_17925 [Myxococcota bacterium]